MLRSKASRWIAAGLAVALLAAAGTAVAQERRRSRDRAAPGRFARKAEGLRRMKRLMDLPEDQLRTALEVSEDAVRIREAAREKAAAILVKAFREGRDAAPEARAALREKGKGEFRAVRDEAKAALREAGRKAAAALTPEQRAKFQERAKARGRTLDEDRLALGIGWRLSDPRARAVLRARLAR